VLSQFSAELAFSAAVSFGIFVCTAFVFGSHQGIRTAVTRYSLLMIRSFDRSRLTFMMNGQLAAGGLASVDDLLTCSEVITRKIPGKQSRRLSPSFNAR
jgi:hypothetical protein